MAAFERFTYCFMLMPTKHVFNTNNYFRLKADLPLIRKNTTASNPTLYIPAAIEVLRVH